MCLREHISSFPPAGVCKAIYTGLKAEPSHGLPGSPDPPIGQLVLLVGLHITAVLQEVGQRELGQRQHTAGLACVKQVHHVDAKVSLKPWYVPVRAMHHLLGVWTERAVHLYRSRDRRRGQSICKGKRDRQRGQSICTGQGTGEGSSFVQVKGQAERSVICTGQETGRKVSHLYRSGIA